MSKQKLLFTVDLPQILHDVLDLWDATRSPAAAGVVYGAAIALGYLQSVKDAAMRLDDSELTLALYALGVLSEDDIATLHIDGEHAEIARQLGIDAELFCLDNQTKSG